MLVCCNIFCRVHKGQLLQKSTFFFVVLRTFLFPYLEYTLSSQFHSCHIAFGSDYPGALIAHRDNQCNHNRNRLCVLYRFVIGSWHGFWVCFARRPCNRGKDSSGVNTLCKWRNSFHKEQLTSYPCPYSVDLFCLIAPLVKLECLISTTLAKSQ